MVSGHLGSEGLSIQQKRVRKCLARVDPRNVRIRCAILKKERKKKEQKETVSRRAYPVAGPNSVWHLNGHHSLVVNHWAINGFSRFQLSCIARQTIEVYL